MVIMVALTLFIAVCMGLLGLFFLLTSSKIQENGDAKMRDEVKPIWQYLGLVDDTPNTFRAVVAGNEDNGPIIGYISNIKGEVYDPILGRTRPLRPPSITEPDGENPYAGESDFARFMRESFGKRVYGYPIIRSIRPLEIDRVVRKGTILKSAKLADQLEAKIVKRYVLYKEILRPTYHTDVDTKDGVRFNVTSYAILNVFNPEPAFTIYSSNFLQTVSDLISSFLSSRIILVEWDEYKARYKEGSRFDITGINSVLEKLGVEVIQLTMSDPELNPAVQAAFEAKATARQQADATREKGKGEKDYLTSVGEGNANAIGKMAKARAQRLTEVINILVSNGHRPETAAEEAMQIVTAEFQAEAMGKLTGTYAPGTGAGVINLGGKK